LQKSFLCHCIQKKNLEDLEIDERLARDDQKLLEIYFRTKRTFRKRLGPPVCPLALKAEKISNNLSASDSSEEEERTENIRIEKMGEPFSGCYLCRTDPGSQHLHVLGDIHSSNLEIEQQVKKPSYGCDSELIRIHKKMFSKFEFLPDFYRMRGLLIRCQLGFTNLDTKVAMLKTEFPICCDRPIRRDEFEDHYKYHQQLENTAFLVRCPLWQYGCGFVHSTLAPNFGKYRYNSFLKMCVHEPKTPVIASPPPPTTTIEQQQPTITTTTTTRTTTTTTTIQQQQQTTITTTTTIAFTFPTQVLLLIAPYLDSASLACLSATNISIRDSLTSLLLNRTIVELRWQKVEEAAAENPEGVVATKYRENGFSCKFSAVQKLDHHHPFSPFQPSAAAAISNHLQRCPFNIVQPPRVPCVGACCVLSAPAESSMAEEELSTADSNNRATCNLM